MKEVFAQLFKGKYVFVHADSYYTGKWIHEHFHAKALRNNPKACTHHILKLLNLSHLMFDFTFSLETIDDVYSQTQTKNQLV